MTCHACRNEGIAMSICKYCDAFLCLVSGCGDEHEAVDDDGRPFSMDCNECGYPVCWQCLVHSDLLPFYQACGRTICRDCKQKSGAGYTRGPDNKHDWCPRCAPDKSSSSSIHHHEAGCSAIV